MENFRGIVLYNIERNGNLNGIYTNNRIIGTQIFTETARLVDDTLVEGETQVHVYDSFYFDFAKRVNCLLTLRITNGIYRAQWQLLDGNLIFEGEGFQMNDRQIAITYWLV